MFDRVCQLNRRRLIERWVRRTCLVTWCLLVLVWVVWAVLT